jgi:hypothetical protein
LRRPSPSSSPRLYSDHRHRRSTPRPCACHLGRYAFLGRPSRPHDRLPRTAAGCCGFLGRLPRPTPPRIVFAVIVRDCTDNDAADSDLPSSRTWRVQRRRRSDQPIWRSSPPSTSPSTRLPPIEHRAAAASPLRAVASPPLVPAAGYQRAFSGVSVAGGSHTAAPTRALQLRRPIGQ